MFLFFTKIIPSSIALFIYVRMLKMYINSLLYNKYIYIFDSKKYFLLLRRIFFRIRILTWNDTSTNRKIFSKKNVKTSENKISITNISFVNRICFSKKKVRHCSLYLLKKKLLNSIQKRKRRTIKILLHLYFWLKKKIFNIHCLIEYATINTLVIQSKKNESEIEREKNRWTYVLFMSKSFPEVIFSSSNKIDVKERTKEREKKEEKKKSSSKYRFIFLCTEKANIPILLTSKFNLVRPKSIDEIK